VNESPLAVITITDPNAVPDVENNMTNAQNPTVIDDISNHVGLRLQQPGDSRMLVQNRGVGAITNGIPILNHGSLRLSST